METKPRLPKPVDIFRDDNIAIFRQDRPDGGKWYMYIPLIDIEEPSMSLSWTAPTVFFKTDGENKAD